MKVYPNFDIKIKTIEKSTNDFEHYLQVECLIRVKGENGKYYLVPFHTKHPYNTSNKDRDVYKDFEVISRHNAVAYMYSKYLIINDSTKEKLLATMDINQQSEEERLYLKPSL